MRSNSPPVRRAFWLGLLCAAVIAAVSLSDPPDAEALAEPQTKGRNFEMNAPNNWAKIVPVIASSNCSITIQVDIDPKDGGASTATAVCSGYAIVTAGVASCTAVTKYTCIMPVCTDTTVGKCMSWWVVRDTAPGAICVLARNAPTDGGVPVLIEEGAGCTPP